MDFIENFKALLVETIRPVVEEAVRASMPTPEPPRDKKYITLRQARDEYQLTSSSIYRKFDCGKLHKYKNGGRTVLDVSEVESLFKKQKQAGVGSTTRGTTRSRL